MVEFGEGVDYLRTLAREARRGDDPYDARRSLRPNPAQRWFEVRPLQRRFLRRVRAGRDDKNIKALGNGKGRNVFEGSPVMIVAAPFENAVGPVGDAIADDPPIRQRCNPAPSPDPA